MRIVPPSRVLVFTIALAACLTVLMPTASSAHAQPSRPAAAVTHAVPQAAYTFRTFCLHGTVECLNDTLCQLNAVQIWNINGGANCTLTATQVGTVNPAGWPFYCHDGLNVEFAGDPVFLVDVENVVINNVAYNYAVQSAGYSNTVTLTPVLQGGGGLDPYIGLWVATSVTSSGTIDGSPMIDAFETCNLSGPTVMPYPQYAYAGCGGNGCLAREDIIGHSDGTWDWRQFTVNESTASGGTNSRARSAAAPAPTLSFPRVRR